MGIHKKVFSLLLTAVLLLGLCPALAAEDPFIIENGVLMEYRGNAASVTVPAGVHTIGFGAFAGGVDWYSVNDTLVSVTLPDSVTRIETYAFANCVKLKNVTMSQSLAVIEEGAFFGCESLARLVLPQSLREIQTDAFQNCQALEEMQIPAGVTEIGEGAISQASCRKEGDFYIAGDGILMAYAGTAQDLVIPSNIKAIHGQLFLGNYDGQKALRSVTIPGSVKTIGSGAFASAFNLVKATLGEGVTYLGDRVFHDCWALTDLVLPSTLKQMGYFALGEPLQEEESGRNRRGGYIPWLASQTAEFVVAGDGLLIHYNGNAQDIVVPDGVKAIGGGVFSHSLDSVMGIHAPKPQPLTVTLPDSVTSIGPYAFHSCYQLTSIRLPAALTTLGVGSFYGCSALTTTVIPEGVSELPRNSFASCSALRSVTLPKSLTKIGPSAFSHCRALTGMVLPTGLKEIGRVAFSSCTELAPLVLPESLALVKQECFPTSEGFTLTVLGKDTRFLYQALVRDSMAPLTVYAPADAAVRREVARSAADGNPITVKDLLVAQPTSARVLINGVEVPFDAYVIEQNNYFKLRDLAMAFQGKFSTFEVTWDSARGAINLFPRVSYTPVGGELALGDGQPKRAIPSTAPILWDGDPISLKAYTIGQNNYVMLRDLQPWLDFKLDWIGETSTIVIDADYGYRQY